MEVPVFVDRSGIHGVPLGHLPKGFAALFYNQVAIYDMTAEAVLIASRNVVLQAQLADPILTVPMRPKLF